MFPRLVLLSAVALLPFPVVAQDSTSQPAVTPFRRGQWAAQFQAGFSTGSLGFVKFRSPTRALVVDLQLSGGHSENIATDSTGSHFDGLNSNVSTQIRFGWRRYRAGTAKLVSHYSFGLLGGFDHNVTRDPSFLSESNGWRAGFFGDVGGTYLVTPQLGLGALASAALSYSNSVSEYQPGNGKGRQWRIGGSAINATLVATLFF